MARNEEHTIQFLAKMLWKYRGTVRLREIMQRLLEFDCIRRNYSKGTLHNLVRQFRAWLKDPNSKHANKLPKAYLTYFEEYKAQESNTESHTTEDTPVENPDTTCIAEPELPIDMQIQIVQAAREKLVEANNKYHAKLDEQITALEQKQSTARSLFVEKLAEYDEVIKQLQKLIIWNEMMQ